MPGIFAARKFDLTVKIDDPQNVCSAVLIGEFVDHARHHREHPAFLRIGLRSLRFGGRRCCGRIAIIGFTRVVFVHQDRGACFDVSTLTADDAYQVRSTES